MKVIELPYDLEDEVPSAVEIGDWIFTLIMLGTFSYAEIMREMMNALGTIAITNDGYEEMDDLFGFIRKEDNDGDNS